MKILSTVCANLIHFFYPAYCLHCEGKLKRPTDLLCLPCFHQIEWIDQSERCPNCWGPNRCKSCLPLHPHRSLFEPTGPLLSLYGEFLKTKHSILLASLIVVALSKTSWEIPEVVIPYITCPLAPKDPSSFLAKEVAKLLDIPRAFPSEKIEGKKVLFLIPSLSNSSHLFKEKKKLAGYFPAKIFTLALLDQRH